MTNSRLKVLILGKSGQLAQALIANKPTPIECVALGHLDINLAVTGEIESAITTNRADIIINTAAYTQVDLAESEPSLAFEINALAVENIAKAARNTNVHLIHLSTDYVFDGKQSTPYTIFDTPHPINIYGASKLTGEKALRQCMPVGSTTVRTSSVYSQYGNNFVKTMLRLMREKSEIKVISDQISSPTSAKELARFLWMLTEQESLSPLYHWCDSGKTSWYQFAVTIQQLALKYGKLEKAISIIPISSQEYGAAALRPPFSQLDIGQSQALLHSKPWQENLESLIKRL
ncbi:dTDP-4-dehydrorhamnose reductase [Shewanella sediminis HAW-EB3]|uniref:dTDP-4-dehydrorhamnose reductase n=1 Tax=Shewanella sediminis (strain HAW-EB3) TaxID=425104 RepID=A8FPE6_SHESH|nr:dTDP-4-dehydrorhamnose reductase [Shewanella sediminis]ABV34719.1 dTDP-4-dehydrorhamnose reductase [Shewanella sediminis HAW-EB3]